MKNLRSLIVSFAVLSLFSVGLLVGCTQLETASVPVSLANAQAEANAMLTAFETLASLTTPTPAQATALAAAKSAVAAFDAIQPGSTYLSAAETVVSDLTPLVSLLPVSGQTATAIQAGIGLVDGLVKGLTSVPEPVAPATPAVGGTLNTVIQAPIPIPVPTT